MWCLKRFCRNMHYRLLYLVWLILPKEHETIKEIKISYVVVPQLLLPGRNMGVVFYHKLSDEIMVLLASSDPFPRYTIWHEYREGQLLKENKSTEQIIGEVTNKMPKLLEGRDDVSLKDLTETIRRWAEEGKEHFEAFIDELLLAKEEMSFQEYRNFLRFRTQRRQ
jgi:hypothetical protein